jgi:thioredoxin 1
LSMSFHDTVLANVVLCRRRVSSQEEYKIRKIRSDAEFKELLGAKALVCDFSASWCGPCKALEPVLKMLEKAFPKAVFAQVDIDEQPRLSDSHGIRAIPTILFVRNGKEVDRIVGYKDFHVLNKLVKKLTG